MLCENFIVFGFKRCAAPNIERKSERLSVEKRKPFLNAISHAPRNKHQHRITIRVPFEDEFPELHTPPHPNDLITLNKPLERLENKVKENGGADPPLLPSPAMLRQDLFWLQSTWSIHRTFPDKKAPARPCGASSMYYAPERFVLRQMWLHSGKHCLGAVWQTKACSDEVDFWNKHAPVGRT